MEPQNLVLITVTINFVKYFEVLLLKEKFVQFSSGLGLALTSVVELHVVSVLLHYMSVHVHVLHTCMYTCIQWAKFRLPHIILFSELARYGLLNLHNEVVAKYIRTCTCTCISIPYIGVVMPLKLSLKDVQKLIKDIC